MKFWWKARTPAKKRFASRLAASTLAELTKLNLAQNLYDTPIERMPDADTDKPAAAAAAAAAADPYNTWSAATTGGGDAAPKAKQPPQQPADGSGSGGGGGVETHMYDDAKESYSPATAGTGTGTGTGATDDPYNTWSAATTTASSAATPQDAAAKNAAAAERLQGPRSYYNLWTAESASASSSGDKAPDAGPRSSSEEIYDAYLATVVAGGSHSDSKSQPKAAADTASDRAIARAMDEKYREGAAGGGGGDDGCAPDAGGACPAEMPASQVKLGADHQISPQSDEEKDAIRMRCVVVCKRMLLVCCLRTPSATELLIGFPIACRDEESIDWNSAYQTLCDTPISDEQDLAAKKEQLNRLVDSFIDHTRRCVFLAPQLRSRSVRC